MAIFKKNPSSISGQTKSTSVKATADTEKKIEETPSTPKATRDKKPFHVAKKKGRRQTARQNLATDLSRVLLRPRITEKATNATGNGVYVFEVSVDATKRDVSKAVLQYYKVVPEKVNVVKIPSKKRPQRGRRTFGRSPVGKKAYVFLKDGDKIEFV